MTNLHSQHSIRTAKIDNIQCSCRRVDIHNVVGVHVSVAHSHVVRWISFNSSTECDEKYNYKGISSSCSHLSPPSPPLSPLPLLSLFSLSSPSPLSFSSPSLAYLVPNDKGTRGNPPMSSIHSTFLTFDLWWGHKFVVAKERGGRREGEGGGRGERGEGRGERGEHYLCSQY